MDNTIKIRGARQHNLKNIDIDIPKNKLVVFTGVSGSGKSSLAFDTIYAEGQRRYVESLSTYARQFLGVMEKPDIDFIEGLSPSISIDQKTTSKNPRSTVGTTTEIYDYLRLLFARIGHPHCPICTREISSQSLDEIVSQVLKDIEENLNNSLQHRMFILSPVVIDKKGEFSSLFNNLKAKGFKYIRVDKYVKDLNDDFVLIKTNKHTIDVIVDRISISKKDYKDLISFNNLKQRLAESIEKSLKLSEGLVIISKILDKSLEIPEFPTKYLDNLYSEKFSCPVDNIQLPEIEPRTFSFNSPHGACPKCMGFGKILKVDPDLIVSPDLSISEGGILPFANIFYNDTWYSRLVLTLCNENNIDPKLTIKNLSLESKNILLFGTGNRQYKVQGTNRFGRLTNIYESFQGFINELQRRHTQSSSDWVKNEIEKYMREEICSECKGSRLKKESLGITINKLSISDVCSFSIQDCILWIEKLEKDEKLLSEKEKQISALILKEIKQRLYFLISVGLNYLTLDRWSGSLSGGEAQRIRLASQIGSGLSGVLYVLDEPTIGLHQKDNQKLINTLKKLRDLGNTVIVVEHDPQMIKQSDFIIDFGPGAGKLGGKIVFKGNSKDILNNKNSLTGKYLSGKKIINVSNYSNFQRNLNIQENKNKKSIKLYGCKQYNLKNIDVEFPLGKLVVITGVSGSGKSTLLVDTLYKALESEINPRFREKPGIFSKIEGVENIDKVILIDQSPIGRTPRSNPATYTKVFDEIRDLFSRTKEAKNLGFNKGRFSFNVKGGRCEACEGQGQIKIEMQFMNDIWVICDICKGKRYNEQTLDVYYRGKNITQVLETSIGDSVEYFHSHTSIVNKLQNLVDVGLGYMELGQPATTLSGGEAQRVKLSSELNKKATGNTVYILDEPTTGLHFVDIEKLLKVLKLLVNKGNSVFVIEHNIDVIRNSDWIIDLGPEGGDQGGKIIFEGDVNNIRKCKNSYTGMFL